LFLKDAALEPRLGAMFTPMLVEMGERGPDSAGVAIYRNPAPPGAVKLTLHHPDPAFAWDDLARTLGAHLDAQVGVTALATHAVLVAPATADAAVAWVRAQVPAVRITSVGTTIEIYKEMGRPEAVAEQFQLARLAGSHAIGHTRMATESAVTTEHSHPFSTGLDLCLVHNGSLSNHNRWRLTLQRHGVSFATDNDTEVAAGYLTHRLRAGDTLEQALNAGLKDLDGFYTFAVGTRSGFAVVRDPIACKHAVLAETAQWVAMATEYRSIARLPGAERARIWEPAPATIYAWSRN